jgi:hypothetical protein
LSRFCGPDDILTRIMPDDARLRSELGYPGQQNDRVSSGRLLNHTSAREVRRHIGDDAWDQYFTFTIERNPIDKAVSRYYWDTRGQGTPGSDEYLATVEANVL